MSATGTIAKAANIRRNAARAGVSALLAASVAMSVSIAEAQTRVPVARDAETEGLLKDYMSPLVKAAGLRMPSIRLVPDSSFNAFVIPGNRMFVNTGSIILSETPNEIKGVLAHELAHIAANDTAQIQQVIQDTQNVMLLAGLLSVGAAAAGSAAGSQAAAQAGTGAFAGIGSLGARIILRYKREQEAAADRAAVAYLNASGQSAAGMISTLSRLANDNLFSSQRANPYLQSHPFARDRAVTVDSMARQSPHYTKRDSDRARARHNLVRAKLVGFTLSQGEVYRVFPRADQSLPARYARAISEYRSGRRQEALRLIDGLIAALPNYAYFHELKGQALLEGGNAPASLAPLRKAVSLSDNSGLINILLGQALVSTSNRQHAEEAVRALTLGLRDAPRTPSAYRALARAYAILDNVPMAQLTTAEGLLIQGNVGEAKAQATRAQANLKRGSPAWLRADDIVSYNPRK